MRLRTHIDAYNKRRLAFAIEQLELNVPKWDCLYLNVDASFIENPVNWTGISGALDVSPISDEDLIQLAEAIKKSTTLTHVIIHTTDPATLEWTAAGTKAIGQALKDYPSLQSLRICLDTDRIAENVSIGFFDALTGSAPLHALDLHVFNLNSQFLHTLGDVLLRHLTFKTIVLRGSDNNPHSAPPSTDSIDHFFNGLSAQKSIEQLHLESVYIGDEGTFCLARHLANTSTLNKLKLSDIGLSAAGIKALNPIIQRNHNIRQLDLSHNDLGLKGIQQVISILPSLIFLQSLSLISTNLNEQATRYFVNQWRALSLTIRTLLLDHNRITAASLYQLINGNVHLKYLSLFGSDFNDKEVAVLAPLLSHSRRCHLEEIAIGKITDYERILAVLKANVFIAIFPEKFDPRIGMSICDSNQLNRKFISMRYRQRCLDQAIDIANAYRAPSSAQKMHFSMLPSDALLIVMSMLYGNTVERMNVALCTLLILNNFSMRRELIKKGQYNPNEKPPKIGQWWSQSIGDHGEKQKTLLQHNRYASLFSEKAAYEESKEVEGSATLACSLM